MESANPGMHRALSLVAVTLAFAVLGGCGKRQPKPIIIRGAVIRQDTDPGKEVPIGDVLITAVDGTASGVFHSDAAGFFSVTFRPEVVPGQAVQLRFRHPDYRVQQSTINVSDKLYVTRLRSLHDQPPPVADASKPQTVVGNI